MVQLVETPAQVTNRHRRQWEDPQLASRRKASALPSEALWCFLSYLPEGSDIPASGRKPLTVRNHQRIIAGWRVEKLLLYPQEALKRRWRWSCGTRWTNCPYPFLRQIKAQAVTCYWVGTSVGSWGSGTGGHFCWHCWGGRGSGHLIGGQSSGHLGGQGSGHLGGHTGGGWQGCLHCWCWEDIFLES